MEKTEDEIFLYSPVSIFKEIKKNPTFVNKTTLIENFQVLNRVGEGTYGIVSRAKDIRNETIVALKKIRMENEKEGLSINTLREISLLSYCNHPNVIRLLSIATELVILDSIYLVMEYCEHDLSSLLENVQNSFREADVKCLSIQLLEGIKYLHSRSIIHRDLKMSNILLSNQGELKISDFGLARICNNPPGTMTQEVVTLWYRPPELLLGSNVYTYSVDMWSVGCIISELLLHRPLLPGKSEATQIEKIVDLLGTPNDKIWPKFSLLPFSSAINWPNQPYSYIQDTFNHFPSFDLISDLIDGLLTYDPRKRLSARSALRHEYFMQSPIPTEKHLLPTYPEHRNRKPGNENKIIKKSYFSDMFNQ